MFGLAADRLFPLETKPGEVFIDRLFKRRACAAGVDIFNAQQEASVADARQPGSSPEPELGN